MFFFQEVLKHVFQSQKNRVNQNQIHYQMHKDKPFYFPVQELLWRVYLVGVNLARCINSIILLQC